MQLRRGPSWSKLDRFWAFHDDSDTTTAIDLSHNGANGTISGGGYRTGPYGLALDADGASTEVSITTPTFTDSYTVIAWFTLDSPDDGDSDGIFVDNENNDVLLQEPGTGRVKFSHTDPDNNRTVLETGSATGIANPRSGQEYIAVARWDGSTIELDMGSREDSISTLVRVDSSDETDLRTGGFGRQAIASGDGGGYLDGSVSGVVLSSEYLFDDEVYWLDTMLNLIKGIA